MSTKDKLIERFKKLPKDFTFDELTRMMASLGYMLDNKGNTSGSRVSFIGKNNRFIMHKPHPGNTIKVAVLRKLYLELLLKKII